MQLRKPGWAIVADDGKVLGFQDQVTGQRSLFPAISPTGTALVVDAVEYDLVTSIADLIPEHTPASSAEAGVVGAMTRDENYIYVWTATNVNKRVALATW